MTKAPSLSNAPAEILVTRLKSIGDIVFTLPAVHTLREHFPDSKITFLTSKENGPLIEGFTDVNDIITIDRAAFHKGRLASIARETLSLWRTLMQKKFSVAIDLQGYGETALLTWLTRAPQRWGSVYRNVRGLAYTRGVTRDPALHPVDWNLFLLKQCGVEAKSVRNEFVLPESAHNEARAVFMRLKLDADKPTLFFQPFTSTVRKNWPLENYLALANHWREQRVQVLFGGGPLDRNALEPAERAGFAVSAGTPILVSAGLTKLSTLVVGGDTGLLHIAVALKKRVVCLAPASRTYPFQHVDWKISPPESADMSGIAVPTVIDACKHAMAESVRVFA
jgi:ADP-heptose:LPS heptosyltransferase